MSVLTDPPSTEMLSVETLSLGIDFAAQLEVGESLSSATASLQDKTTGSAYASGLSGSASISGTTVAQTVTALVPGHDYLLTLGATVSATKIIAARLTVRCPAP